MHYCQSPFRTKLDVLSIPTSIEASDASFKDDGKVCSDWGERNTHFVALRA